MKVKERREIATTTKSRKEIEEDGIAKLLTNTNKYLKSV